MKIVIITPIRNEEEYIKTTLESMISQTLLPVKWIIVNDGSTDNTEKIIKNYLQKSPFIEYKRLSNRGYRKPAKGVIEAFYEGLKIAKNINYDIIAKLDGDLKFSPDTLEKICKAFQADPKLGITGGLRYERIKNNGPYKKVLVPKGFVGGPYKFYRKGCFKEINGLILRAGWDGVDTIKANMKGWRTGELDSIKFIHLKPTGSAKGEGLSKACEKYGNVSYYMGGYFWYFLVRVISRSLERTNPKIGFYMLKGYIKSLLNKEKRESTEFRKYLKKVQIQNIKEGTKLVLKFTKHNLNIINSKVLKIFE